MENTKGLLDYACCYLAGSMEYVSDHGVGWRREFIKLIRENKLRIDCIDPTNKPGGDVLHINEDKAYQVKLQKEGKFQELAKFVGRYRRYDLRYVDQSDFVVAAIHPTIPQWGTSNEVYFAEMQHKPMFFICEGGLYNLPRWLFDVIDIDKGDGKRLNVFETVQEVVDELVKIDRGIIPMGDEWVLVRKFIEESRDWNYD